MIVFARKIRGFCKVKSSNQLINKFFLLVDAFLVVLCLAILIISDNRSTCLATFYLFWTLFYTGQTIAHYLLLKLPMMDVIKYDNSIKRLIGIVCFIQIWYLFLVIIFWQKSSIHPLYCAMCQEFQFPLVIGTIFIIHLILTGGIMISLIHLFVTRKYYLIALGGFQVEQRLALQRQSALRRIGLIEPNYMYPIQGSIKSNKYYTFQDVIQPGQINEDICSICLNRKLSTQNIIRTQCNHFYHRACVQKWATVNSRCPDCRAQFMIQNRNGQYNELNNKYKKNNNNNNENNNLQGRTDRQLLQQERSRRLSIIEEQNDNNQNIQNKQNNEQI